MTQPDPAKQHRRAQLRAGRAARSADDRARARYLNARHLVDRLSATGTVAAYLPLPSEPLAHSVLDELAVRGVRVLIPVVSHGAPLDWAEYPCPTTPGALGIAEPAGPRLGIEAVRSADVLVIPASAVDRSGIRLGRGGGHYDRTLALLDGLDVPVIAVLFDGELVGELPAEPHDRPVSFVVTPSGGIEPVGV